MKKSRRLLCLLLALAMILVITACGESGQGEEAAGSAAESAAAEIEAPPADVLPDNVKVQYEDSRFFEEGSIGRWTTIATYAVDGFEDVPYISVKQYLAYICDDVSFAWDDGILTATHCGSNAVIDTKENTIAFENASAFAGPNAEGAINSGILETEEFDVIRVSTMNSGTETEAEPLTIKLDDYQVTPIACGEDVLLPFLVLQNTFGMVANQNIYSYNGKDYFDIVSVSDELAEYNASEKKIPYFDAYFSGPFTEKDTCTKAYANYAYYTTCLLLDLSYGHKDELGVENFDAYFTKLSAKKAMTSTNPADVMAIEALLIYYLFDSGHDALLPEQGVYGRKTEMKSTIDNVKDEIDLEDPTNNTDFANEVFESILNGKGSDALAPILFEKDDIPEVTGLYGWTIYMSATKPGGYGDLRLDYSGDTAVIYFDAFMNDVTSQFYLKPPTKADYAKSNFAFFYHCFEDIKKHKEVKNVVINLSNNGGGYAAGLVTILGFLSPDGEAKFTTQAMLSNQYREEYYHVDTNLDGVFDDQDGYGGQYDFYIMTSGSSYSCATALPFFAQKQGLAKIMGAKPGGGDCVVGMFIDAFGMHGVISGKWKIGVQTEKGFVSDEKAVKMDLKMGNSILDIPTVPWYDADGIAKEVRKYKKANKE